MLYLCSNEARWNGLFALGLFVVCGIGAKRMVAKDRGAFELIFDTIVYHVH
jgi:hypothetical protein